MRHRLSANGDPPLARATGRATTIVAATAGVVLPGYPSGGGRPGAHP